MASKNRPSIQDRLKLRTKLERLESNFDEIQEELREKINNQKEVKSPSNSGASNSRKGASKDISKHLTEKSEETRSSSIETTNFKIDELAEDLPAQKLAKSDPDVNNKTVIKTLPYETSFLEEVLEPEFISFDIEKDKYLKKAPSISSASGSEVEYTGGQKHENAHIETTPPDIKSEPSLEENILSFDKNLNEPSHTKTFNDNLKVSNKEEGLGLNTKSKNYAQVEIFKNTNEANAASVKLNEPIATEPLSNREETSAVDKNFFDTIIHGPNLRGKIAWIRLVMMIYVAAVGRYDTEVELTGDEILKKTGSTDIRNLKYLIKEVEAEGIITRREGRHENSPRFYSLRKSYFDLHGSDKL